MTQPLPQPSRYLHSASGVPSLVFPDIKNIIVSTINSMTSHPMLVISGS
ncbi:hypothetical protein [Coleofasciculus sp. FACHB-64]|nr:hypothetical protein [Coleofasciculus sp. FACHB-64]